MTTTEVAALAEGQADPYIAEAKRLLWNHLRGHADEGVRAINEIAEPADKHPAVIKLAAELRVRNHLLAGGTMAIGQPSCSEIADQAQLASGGA